MSNRIYSKNKAEARLVNLVNAMTLSNIVSAAKSVTYYALQHAKALALATAIYCSSKKSKEVNQPKDYVQPLRISGLKFRSERISQSARL